MYPSASKTVTRAFTLLLVTSMAGCAVRLPYVAPSNGPISRLLVRSNSFVPGRYVLDTFDDAKRCSAPKTIAQAVADKFDVAVNIRAGQEISLRLSCTQNVLFGNYIVTFDAKPDHKYEVAPFSDQKSCGMVIFDVTSGDRVLDPSARKRTITPYIEGGFCASEKSTVVVMQKSQASGLGDLVDLLPKTEEKDSSSETKTSGPIKK